MRTTFIFALSFLLINCLPATAQAQNKTSSLPLKTEQLRKNIRKKPGILHNTMTSSRSITEKLDSIIGDSFKMFLEYDSNGKNTSATFIEEWNNEQYGMKINYTHETNGNIKSITFSEEENGTWYEEAKYDYTYISGKLSNVTYYERDHTLNTWEVYGKMEYTYSNEKLILTKEFEYNNGTWNQFGIEEFIYNTDGQVYQKIKPQYKKEEYIYSPQGKPTEENTYFYDDLTSEWVYYSQWEFDYNIQGNTTAITGNSNWKDEYEYNLSVSASNIAYPYIVLNGFMETEPSTMPPQTFFILNKITKLNFYTKEVASWVLDGECFFYYSPFLSTEVKETNQENLNIFPNPAMENISIQLEKEINHARIELLNSLGQVISSEEIQNLTNTQIRLPEQKGVYFIRINNGNQVQTHKIIRQ